MLAFVLFRSHYKNGNIFCILKDANSISSQDDVVELIKTHGITSIIVLHAYRAGKWICGLG